jgi:hypothetical protein
MDAMQAHQQKLASWFATLQAQLQRCQIRCTLQPTTTAVTHSACTLSDMLQLLQVCLRL